MKVNVGDIIFNEITGIVDPLRYSTKELIPNVDSSTYPQIFTRDSSIYTWISLDKHLNIIVNNYFSDTNIYYSNNRIGLGRAPLHNYKLDISVESDKVQTGIHVGDGSFGFSLGNGTTSGVLPEIIGIGSDENNTGLYLLGLSGNDKESSIPLVIIDGRDYYAKKLTNRPVLGITSGTYDEYYLTVNADGTIIIKEELFVKDIIINNISLITTIKTLENEIEYLKTKLT